MVDLYARVNGGNPATVAMVLLMQPDERRTTALASCEGALSELVGEGKVQTGTYRNQPHYFLARANR